MNLSTQQRGVLHGMLIGAACALAVVLFGAWFNPFAFAPDLDGWRRIGVAVKAGSLPALFLAISIGRLAGHRFFTPADIDGGGVTPDTDRARQLQAILQNTLEQTVLAIVVYAAWAVVMPATTLSVVPLAAIAFAVGRTLFFAGYRYGAPARALGFTLSFYTSLGMLGCILCRLALDRIATLA